MQLSTAVCDVAGRAAAPRGSQALPSLRGDQEETPVGAIALQLRALAPVSGSAVNRASWSRTGL